MTMRNPVVVAGSVCLLFLSGLACQLTSQIENLHTLSGLAYWVAVTETAVPTVTVFLGTTTAVYPPTPVPAQQTLPPGWVTTEPVFITTTPDTWVTTTPQWQTTTPVYIMETPVPPWTTTPELDLIGYTTPVPTGTPYYRVGTFYLNQDIIIDYPNPIVIRVNGYELHDSVTQADSEAYLLLDVTIKNYSGKEAFVPATDIFFIREVDTVGGTHRRAWSAADEPLEMLGWPSYKQQLEDSDGNARALAHEEARRYTLGFILPKGVVAEVGVVTDLGREVNGGVPIWVRLENDPIFILGEPCAPYRPGCMPPPPTPIIFDENGTYTGGGGLGDATPPPGIGLWPTNGTITRGYGCEEFYTGVDGAGFGCPSARPWFHNGVDVANSHGNPVWSPIDGSLDFAGFNPNAPDCSDIDGSQPPHNGLGNYQRITDGDTLHYLGHLSGFRLTGGSVVAGDQVSQMGSTGCSTGSHLHWIVYDSGTLIDPQSWAGPGPPP